MKDGTQAVRCFNLSAVLHSHLEPEGGGFGFSEGWGCFQDSRGGIIGPLRGHWSLDQRGVPCFQITALRGCSATLPLALGTRQVGALV